ncbi:nuclear transport factor 2 family protein [Occallatibacter riparius]|uniref:Nuclear transport factor 2 family protein n=1 Tax=Occallatibacter riparius TaxID=1002689 RepID=A0A9J7BR24_9BACT|nr:nuclear transport factor 2 family protein [Occallatibacter riparius]UWZ85031.1 nuclear transport factor 2 family protein [Occallatibacter riparius]
MTKSDPPGRGSERARNQLRRLEQSLLDLAVRRDGDRLRQLLSDDFLEFGSSGRVWTRKSIIDMLATETNFFPPAIEEFECTFLSEKVALVTYRTVRTDAKTGERLSSLRSSVWTRQNGEWRMRFHQGTRTG